jgi:flavin reductase (DIM6/NTAB) family NADH-FMN oxidoreductase RutF
MKKKKLGSTTLLFPMPVVLVGTVVEDKVNFMTAAWCGIANQKPAAISVAIRKSRLTLRGVQENGAFSINIPSAEQVKKTDFCGIYSGRKIDKSSLFEVFYGDLERVPLIMEAPLNLECKVLNTMSIGTHDLVVGEIVQTHVTDSVLKDGIPDPEKINPLIYCTGASGGYYTLGSRVAQAFHVGK